jgi:hypothetical protein
MEPLEQIDEFITKIDNYFGPNLEYLHYDFPASWSRVSPGCWDCPSIKSYVKNINALFYMFESYLDSLTKVTINQAGRILSVMQWIDNHISLFKTILRRIQYRGKENITLTRKCFEIQIKIKPILSFYQQNAMKNKSAVMNLKERNPDDSLNNNQEDFIKKYLPKIKIGNLYKYIGAKGTPKRLPIKLSNRFTVGKYYEVLDINSENKILVRDDNDKRYRIIIYTFTNEFDVDRPLKDGKEIDEPKSDKKSTRKPIEDGKWYKSKDKNQAPEYAFVERVYTTDDDWWVRVRGWSSLDKMAWGSERPAQSVKLDDFTSKYYTDKSYDKNPLSPDKKEKELPLVLGDYYLCIKEVKGKLKPGEYYQFIGTKESNGTKITVKYYRTEKFIKKGYGDVEDEEVVKESPVRLNFIDFSKFREHFDINDHKPPKEPFVEDKKEPKKEDPDKPKIPIDKYYKCLKAKDKKPIEVGEYYLLKSLFKGKKSHNWIVSLYDNDVKINLFIDDFFKHFDTENPIDDLTGKPGDEIEEKPEPPGDSKSPSDFGIEPNKYYLQIKGEEKGKYFFLKGMYKKFGRYYVVMSDDKDSRIRLMEFSLFLKEFDIKNPVNKKPSSKDEIIEEPEEQLQKDKFYKCIKDRQNKDGSLIKEGEYYYVIGVYEKDGKWFVGFSEQIPTSDDKIYKYEISIFNKYFDVEHPRDQKRIKVDSIEDDDNKEPGVGFVTRKLKRGE